MLITPTEARALAGIAERGEAIVARAVDWCGVGSGSRNRDGLERMAATLADAVAALPGAVERVALAPSIEIGPDGRAGEQAHTDALRLTVRPDAPIQIALTGHYDTVYPAESRFTAVSIRPDGALNGPGIADMKGGISVMLAALAAFETHPDAGEVGWRVLLSPDEEIGSPATAPLLAELGRTAHVGLTYEPALADGGLAGARKGSGNFSLVVRGRAAHAGRDFASGRNAVAAAARLAGELHELNGRREGVTLNVARINGGAPLNMVPEVAVVRFNVRVPDAEAAAWTQGRVAAVAAADLDDGLSAELHGGFTRPPKPFTPVQAALFEAARDAASALGQRLTWQPSGGVCEGNNLFAAGLPNIDTLGVRGGDIHSDAEHAWPDSFVERAQLSTLLLMRVASGVIDARALRAAMPTPYAGAA